MVAIVLAVDDPIGSADGSSVKQDWSNKSRNGVLRVIGSHPTKLLAVFLIFNAAASLDTCAQDSASEPRLDLLAPGEVEPVLGGRVASIDRGVASPRSGGISSQRLSELMRPNFEFGAEWLSEADDVELSMYNARVKVPTYPIFGPPPPIVSLGFAFTDLRAPSPFDLPPELYETSLGLAWMRRWNERWMIRSMLGVAHATDGNNNSSDAWQFRGGIFALYRPNQRWTWTFGALALGRNDIPVVPAIGLIYQPRPEVRFDLAFPRPRLSLLLTDDGTRQQWGYVGAGLNGATWAYQQRGGVNDQITYRDWRLVLGWESTPRLEPGMPFARGRHFGAEIGYAFGREFEFERGRSDFGIDDAVMLRGFMKF